MNWDHLRFFLSVADTGSLQGAARRLGVNHSTVFRRINQFEEALGIRLFDRLANGYQLTTAGEEVLSHARRIGEEIDLLQLKVAGKDFRPSGNIRLTAPDNLAYEYLPGYLSRFSRQYPEIHIELIVGSESLDLTRREADIAVRATTSPPQHLIGRKVATVKWGHFASENYLKAKGWPQSTSDLKQHKLIGADGALHRLPPFRAMQNEKNYDIALACSTLNAMSAMAVADAGIALLPDDQRKPELIRLFDANPMFSNDIWLLTHPELRRTERIRLLIQHLADCFRLDQRLHPTERSKDG